MVSCAPIRALEESPVAPVTATRLHFVDNLRWLMIVLVVTMHAAVTYSGIGSWYYKEPRPLGPPSLLFFLFYQTHLQAFFMGLLFLVAGYFVPGSFDRKGPRRFLADRLVRLGIPTLLYALAIDPLIRYMLDRPTSSSGYLTGVVTLQFLGRTGPLWFALALLIFSTTYTLVRLVRPPRPPSPADRRLPTSADLVLLATAIALCTFVIRIVQPIGTSVLNMQLCFFSQYVALFVVGIVAYRHDWLTRIPSSTGTKWLWLAATAGPVAWFAVMLTGGALKGRVEPYAGGLHWQSAAYCVWESFFCVGACVGLLVLFRDRFDTQGPVSRLLSENAFAVYVFHAPVLVALALAARTWPLPAFLKFALLSLTGFAATVLLGHFMLRRLPGIRRVL